MNPLKSKIGRFLGLFAAYGPTAEQYVPQGMNEGNVVYARVTVPHAMIANDTWTVTTPAGADPVFLPAKLNYPQFVPPTPPATVWTAGLGFTVTQHDASTGTTTLKALGTAAVGDIVLLEYINAVASSTLA